MKIRQWISSSILISLTLSGAHAQNLEDEDLLDSYGGAETFSTANGKSQPLEKAPAAASVITAQQIKTMGATNLDEVLESVPGLHVSLSSARFSPVYSIRGIQTDKNPQVLMLINGVPMTELYFGDRGPRSTLPVNSIARVEVIRGPGSTVYGADAFAGVINVITKTADDIEGVEVGARAGSFDSKEGWVLFGAKRADWNFFFSLEAFETDGDDRRRIQYDSQSAFDENGADLLGLAPVSLAPGQANTDKQRIDIRVEASNQNWIIRAWNLQQEGGNGPGVAAALDPVGEGKANNFLADITYKNHNSDNTFEYYARLSYSDINTETKNGTLFPQGTTLPIGADGNLDTTNFVAIVEFPDGFLGNPEVDENHTRLDLTSFYSGYKEHEIRIAAGASYQELNAEENKNFGPGVLDENTVTLPLLGAVVDGTLTDVTGTEYMFIPDEDRTIYYLSLQDQWNVATDWTLTMGVRYDEYSDFGSTVNPRAALVWETQHNLTTKFLYGRAFRAPSFAELFTANNPVVAGNPDLDPEVINTFEIAFDFRPRHNLQTGLNIFYYEIDDLIEFVSEPGLASSTAQNVGEQEGRGVEVEGSWTIRPDLLINANYAYQNTEDTNGDPTPNAPENQAYLQLIWKFSPNWFASTQGSWIGDRQRSADDDRGDIDDYTLVNLTLGCQCFTPKLNLSLAMKNAFDSNADEPSPIEVQPANPGDYPLEGRSVFFSADYSF